MLPRISHRIVMTKMPSDGREVRFRPMRGREEKTLLMAKEAGEGEEILSAVRQVVQGCLVDEVDVDDMPIFDVEWLFIQIRIESVSPVSQVSYIDGSDGRRYDFEVDLRGVSVVKHGDSEPGTIDLGEGVVIRLRWPRVRDFIDDRVVSAEREGDVAHELAMRSIETVFDGDQAIDADLEPREELERFVDSLDVDSYKRLIDHVASTPSLRYEIKYTNSKGEEREVVLENLTDFFRFS